MSESYTAVQADTRTFGEQQSRLLSDLNRPDLSGQVIVFLQDAMRFMQRKPFFFSDTDNTTVPVWAASTIYPQGSTITFTSGGSTYIAVASNTGTSNASSAPSFTTTIFSTPTSGFPPPAIATAGTTDDNGGPTTGIRWLTIENATANSHTVNYWTQLSTVYAVNQYTPPLDYIAPRLVEITIPNIRYQMGELSYPELRSYDVIRPNVMTSYPTWWAWFQQQIYVWPYPTTSFPITLSYRTAPQLARNATDTNFWTTKAEALIRNYAAGLIQQQVLYDEAAAQAHFNAAGRELNALVSQGINQQANQSIAPSEW